MLWDVSWDQNNVINGQRYSEYAFKELGGLTNTVPPVTTQAPPPPVTTQAPPPPGTTQAPPPPTGRYWRAAAVFCVIHVFQLEQKVHVIKFDKPANENQM